jgi:VanZ family protein
MRPSYWLPAAGWMVFILWLSSGSFAAERTALLLSPLAEWLSPWVTAGDLAAIHYATRKLAHFIVYAILALLWYRAFARGQGLRAGSAGWRALGIAVAWACVDELHQSTIATRTGSVADVMLDSVGAATALGVIAAGRPGARLLTTVLLWTAAVGGLFMLALNWLMGVSSGWLWATTPAAWLVVWLRRRGLFG